MPDGRGWGLAFALFAVAPACKGPPSLEQVQGAPDSGVPVDAFGIPPCAIGGVCDAAVSCASTPDGCPIMPDASAVESAPSDGDCATTGDCPPPRDTCSEEQDTRGRVLFHVPRAGETISDFYGLPFPNDIHFKNGKLSLSGHVRAGVGLLGFDPVDRYVQALEADAHGFSVNPAIYVRFSRNPSALALKASRAIGYYDITPGSPDYGKAFAFDLTATNASGRYICARSAVIRHAFGAPLRPGTTYAVVLRRSITDEDGSPMEPDEDFKTMLGAVAPSSPDLAAAWAAYAPLRTWIADKQIASDELSGAAVFTTDRVDDSLLALRSAVRATDPPLWRKVVHCGAPGVLSPCDDGKTGTAHERGCFGTDKNFDEYQGTVSIPIFQAGTPPYDQPANGGGLDLDAAGQPRVQRQEDVCFTLTIPKSAAPATGWPLVIYAHGTGGDYRSVIDLGLAGDYASGKTAGGPWPAMATLGYDGVLHGPRRGASTRPPTELVYNFFNPAAARGNALQAAADLFALARAVEEFSADVVPGVALDHGKLAVYGHSQGGNAAANAVGFEPLFGEAVLSGTGGTLVFTLLKKTMPTNIASLIPLALGEAKVDENDPVLNLLQMYFDRADSVNFGRRLVTEPIAGAQPRHILHVYGTGDSYAPVEGQRTFAKAASFDLATPAIDRYGLAELLPPVQGNKIAADGSMVTAVQIQYQPGSYDGHFVSTENPGARRAIHQMLGSFVRDGIPTVTP